MFKFVLNIFFENTCKLCLFKCFSVLRIVFSGNVAKICAKKSKTLKKKLKPTTTCKNLQKPTKTCTNLQKPAQTYKNL